MNGLLSFLVVVSLANLIVEIYLWYFRGPDRSPLDLAHDRRALALGGAVAVLPVLLNLTPVSNPSWGILPGLMLGTLVARITHWATTPRREVSENSKTDRHDPRSTVS